MLHILTGTVLEVRRYANVHYYGYSPPRPSDRYEFWIRDAMGVELPFSVNTRTFPARRGHPVALVVKVNAGPLAVQILGLYNRSTGHTINYLQTDPPYALRFYDICLVVPALVSVLIWRWGEAGWVWGWLSSAAYLVLAWLGRRLSLAALSRQVERALSSAARYGTPANDREAGA